MDGENFFFDTWFKKNGYIDVIITKLERYLMKLRGWYT
jgi:hypothetical protein